MCYYRKNLSMNTDIAEEKLISIAFLDYFNRIRTG